MLPSLRHGPLVSSHDEEGRVNAPHSSEHVLDEVLVSRDVHDAHDVAAGGVAPSEAQIYGHFPFLLLFEAVGVNASKGFHQCGLAMINVSGGANNLHAVILLCQSRSTEADEAAGSIE